MLHLYVKIPVFCLCLFCLSVKGQDPVFSQYFLNQNYLNPAFAGFTNDLTVSLNSRAQYLRVPGVLMSNTLSANISCEDETRLGIGILAYNHVEGEGLLTSTNFSGQLSANFPFKFKWGSRGRKYKAIVSGGLQFGAGQKYIDWNRLTFSDQYSAYSNGIQRPSNIIQRKSSSNIFLDAGLGIRTSLEFGSLNKPRFLSAGASAFHINRPYQTFINSEFPLEPRYSFYLFTYWGKNRSGRKKDLRYLTIGSLADYQQGMHSHTLSIYKDGNEYFTVGVSLRRQNFILIDRNVDAIIPHFLLYLDALTVGLSYEWTTSSLGEEETFGTAEIGIKWRFEGQNLCKTRRASCPIKGFDMGHDMPNIYF